jgi:hypothetical protein
VIEKMFTHAGLQAHASDCFEATNSAQSMSLIGRSRPVSVCLQNGVGAVTNTNR